jgi:Uma2 family endonuclease
MTAIAERPLRTLTIEEYLELEERSHHKHHFINGQLIAMPGGTLKHNMICSNIITALNNIVRKDQLPFLVSNSDTKIWIPGLVTFFYPDAVVICEVPEYFKGRKDVIINPLLVVEVASSSTEAYDRGEKFLAYATLPSFREYLIVYQDSPLAHRSNRTEADLWQVRSVEGIEQDIELCSIGCSISMRDIYYKTEHL